MFGTTFYAGISYSLREFLLHKTSQNFENGNYYSSVPAHDIQLKCLEVTNTLAYSVGASMMTKNKILFTEKKIKFCQNIFQFINI